MPLLAGAEPFLHNGLADAGILLCHGFTATPASMLPWGRHLADAGYTVRCPRLPGHGTSWREMNRTTWQDWYACVRAELEILRASCQAVFVFGMSMGGTLTLRLAQEYGADIAGIALVNPSVTTLRKDAKLLPLLSRVLPSIPGVAGDIAKPGAHEPAYTRVPVRAAASLARLWRVVLRDLDRVDQPLLLMHSIIDHVVEPVNARLVADGVASSDIVDVVLPNSFHVATLDYDAPLIFEQSVRFIRRITNAPPSARQGDTIPAADSPASTESP